jgi:hypothetical protein
MERTDGKKNEETLRIRLSTELMNRIRVAKTPAGWGEEADSSFARHLMIEGLKEVELRNEEKRMRAAFVLKRAESPEAVEREKIDGSGKPEPYKKKA